MPTGLASYAEARYNTQTNTSVNPYAGKTRISSSRLYQLEKQIYIPDYTSSSYSPIGGTVLIEQSKLTNLEKKYAERRNELQQQGKLQETIEQQRQTLPIIGKGEGRKIRTEGGVFLKDYTPTVSGPTNPYARGVTYTHPNRYALDQNKLAVSRGRMSQKQMIHNPQLAEKVMGISSRNPIRKVSSKKNIQTTQIPLGDKNIYNASTGRMEMIREPKKIKQTTNINASVGVAPSVFTPVLSVTPETTPIAKRSGPTYGGFSASTGGTGTIKDFVSPTQIFESQPFGEKETRPKSYLDKSITIPFPSFGKSKTDAEKTLFYANPTKKIKIDLPTETQAKNALNYILESDYSKTKSKVIENLNKPSEYDKKVFALNIVNDPKNAELKKDLLSSLNPQQKKTFFSEPDTPIILSPREVRESSEQGAVWGFGTGTLLSGGNVIIGGTSAGVMAIVSPIAKQIGRFNEKGAEFVYENIRKSDQPLIGKRAFFRLKGGTSRIKVPLPMFGKDEKQRRIKRTLNRANPTIKPFDLAKPVALTSKELAREVGRNVEIGSVAILGSAATNYATKKLDPPKIDYARAKAKISGFEKTPETQSFDATINVKTKGTAGFRQVDVSKRIVSDRGGVVIEKINPPYSTPKDAFERMALTNLDDAMNLGIKQPNYTRATLSGKLTGLTDDAAKVASKGIFKSQEMANVKIIRGTADDSLRFSLTGDTGFSLTSVGDDEFLSFTRGKTLIKGGLDPTSPYTYKSSMGTNVWTPNSQGRATQMGDPFKTYSTGVVKPSFKIERTTDIVDDFYRIPKQQGTIKIKPEDRVLVPIDKQDILLSNKEIEAFYKSMEKNPSTWGPTPKNTDVFPKQMGPTITASDTKAAQRTAEQLGVNIGASVFEKEVQKVTARQVAESAAAGVGVQAANLFYGSNAKTKSNSKPVLSVVGLEQVSQIQVPKTPISVNWSVVNESVGKQKQKLGVVTPQIQVKPPQISVPKIPQDTTKRPRSNVSDFRISQFDKTTSFNKSGLVLSQFTGSKQRTIYDEIPKQPTIPKQVQEPIIVPIEEPPIPRVFLKEATDEKQKTGSVQLPRFDDPTPNIGLNLTPPPTPPPPLGLPIVFPSGSSSPPSGFGFDYPKYPRGGKIVGPKLVPKFRSDPIPKGLFGWKDAPATKRFKDMLAGARRFSGPAVAEIPTFQQFEAWGYLKKKKKSKKKRKKKR